MIYTLNTRRVLLPQSQWEGRRDRRMLTALLMGSWRPFRKADVLQLGSLEAEPETVILGLVTGDLLRERESNRKKTG